MSAGLLLPNAACAARFPADVALPIPDLIDARANGNAIQLTAQQGQHVFTAGRAVPTLGYSRPILGPAFRFWRGDNVRVSITNAIDAPTIVHWHGLLIPSVQDGAPHDHIDPGQVWTRTMAIDQNETTAWFHPHTYGDTARQVYGGLAGLVLIEDGVGARIGLPHQYGVDDIPLILQDRLIEADGRLSYPTGFGVQMFGARGNTVIANGALAPTAHVPKSIVRFRLLNGSNARNFDLRFDDARKFFVIASDGGYLSAPSPVDHLWVAPGERYEILVDCSDGRPTTLETGADFALPAMGMMMGGSESPAMSIMRMVPDREAAGVRGVPDGLVDLAPAVVPANATRRRLALNDMSSMMGGMMGGGMMRAPGAARFGINGQAFDMARIDATVSLGTQEVWNISTEMMAHPFHVHGVHFRVLSVDGASPPAHMSGWKDTVLVRRTAEILIPFTRPAPPGHPFMFHCHILEHEDAGMMGQYVCG